MKSVVRSFVLACVVVLAGCASFTPPPYDVAAATSMTDAQAKAQIRQIFADLRKNAHDNDAQDWEGWIDHPFVVTAPMCGQVLGYNRNKPIAIENLTFGYNESSGKFAVISVFNDFPGCNERPRGVMWWSVVNKAQAKALAEAFFALGAKPVKVSAQAAQ